MLSTQVHRSTRAFRHETRTEDLNAIYCRLATRVRPWQELWQSIANHPWFQNQLRISARRAVRMSGQTAGAIDDVMQEVHLSLARRLARRGHLGFDPGKGTLENFLAMVIRRNCINASRKLRSSVALEYEARRSPVNWQKRYRESLASGDLNESVQALPEPLASVVRLYSHGHSVAEIAVELDSSKRTVYRRLNEATNKLRDLVGS